MHSRFSARTAVNRRAAARPPIRAVLLLLGLWLLVILVIGLGTGCTAAPLAAPAAPAHYKPACPGGG